MTHPEELLLERAKKALDTAVAFGLADKRRRRGHAEKRELVLKVATEIHAAVVVPKREAVRGGGRKPAEMVADALAQRLEGFLAFPDVSVPGGCKSERTRKASSRRQSGAIFIALAART